MQKGKFFLLLPILLAACAPVLPGVVSRTPNSSPYSTEAPAGDQTLLTETPTLQATDVSLESKDNISIPPNPLQNKRVDDPNEYRIGQMLPWDGIRPVYDPGFASAAEVELQDGELVMGVFLDGEAKAYPVSVLRFREMVNDEIAGWPVLVTW